MSDETFDGNFVWYEWSFVSPRDLPRDDTDGPAGREKLEAAPARESDADRWNNRWNDRGQ